MAGNPAWGRPHGDRYQRLIRGGSKAPSGQPPLIAAGNEVPIAGGSSLTTPNGTSIYDANGNMVDYKPAGPPGSQAPDLSPKPPIMGGNQVVAPNGKTVTDADGNSVFYPAPIDPGTGKPSPPSPAGPLPFPPGGPKPPEVGDGNDPPGGPIPPGGPQPPSAPGNSNPSWQDIIYDIGGIINQITPPNWGPGSYPSYPTYPSQPVIVNRPPTVIVNEPPPVVINGTAGSTDLVLEDVQYVEPATLLVGPAYRVKFRNQGMDPVVKFRVALVAGKSGQAMAEAPRAIVEVAGLVAGQAGEATIRLPRAAFTHLLVVVDIDDAVSELDETNNSAVVERTVLETASRY